MENVTPPFALFPYQVLSEQDLRTLALLIPRTRLLQVLEPTSLPAWGSSHFEVLPTVSGDQEAQSIRQALASFDEFAAVHRDHCLKASYNAESLLRQNWESRFDIETSLRGRGKEGPDPEARRFLEAALFLEMARELDQRQTDLESDLAEAALLETEFREILGIREEEETPEDTLETLSPPLTTSRAHLSFMLPKRIASWLQVFSRTPFAAQPFALVTVNHEVMDEIADKVEAATRHRPSRPELIQAPLAPVPRLPKLPADDFATRLGAILLSQELLEYRRSFAALLSDPKNQDLQKALSRASENQRNAIETTFDTATGPQAPVTELRLTFFLDWSLAELTQAIDPGSPAPPHWAGRPAPPLLCLKELS
jgi:hypothetical protein